MDYKHAFIIFPVAAIVLVGAAIAGYRALAEDKAPPKSVILAVPSITQAPGGNWDNPWGNACEEASAVMVQAFYTGQKLTQPEANKEMERLFAWENAEFGYNEDTSAEEIVRMIEATTTFKAAAVAYPSLEDIKKELRAGHPVIALVNQAEFYKKAPSKQKAASYHVFVVVGYDDTRKIFIINDPADPGVRRYPYDRLMGALHDLDAESEATGKPVVVFTGKESVD